MKLIEIYEKSFYYENSILIITGDHSYSIGTDKSNEFALNANPESFSVPFLIIDPHNNLKNNFSELENLTFSHMNLGPTILDLSGIESKTNFIANSIFGYKKIL